MNETICRLCLQTISNGNCQAISETFVKTLKLKPKITKETVMCIECASCLQVLSKFAPRFVYKGARTVPLSDLENGIGLDPVRTEGTNNLASLMDTEIKCSFCTEAYGRDVVSLNESKENKFMVNILERYISKMNLNNTEELLACGACLEKLEGASGVILKSLEVEEKIREYIKLKGTDDKGHIELKEVQLSMSMPGLKLEIESIGMSDLEGSCAQIKEEDTTMMELEGHTEIKEVQLSMSMPGLKLEIESVCMGDLEGSCAKIKEDTTMTELEVKYGTDISYPELIIKTDDIKSEQSDCDVTDTKSEKSDCDGFWASFNENKTSNDSLHKSVVISEARKSKDVIKQHLLTHTNSSKAYRFKCELCPHEAKQKGHLSTHLLTHKSPCEVKMFKCEVCSFETNYKGSLKLHVLTHKSPSEIKMFKCELCSYETKHKSNLGKHLLTHKSPSELKMFKCELCPYEAKLKRNLKSHLLIHKSPCDVKMFQCELCSYATKQKRNLKPHLLTHTGPSETSKIQMFKCEFCSYESKHKSNLKAHFLTHKSPFEVKMFKCDLCSYETKRKSSLKTHSLTHKSPSDVEMFKCEVCSFETKQKSNLKAHLLTHRSPSEIKIFKCEMCSYGARRKDRLKQHLLLVHGGTSELDM